MDRWLEAYLASIYYLDDNKDPGSGRDSCFTKVINKCFLAPIWWSQMVISSPLGGSLLTSRKSEPVTKETDTHTHTQTDTLLI